MGLPWRHLGRCQGQAVVWEEGWFGGRAPDEVNHCTGKWASEGCGASEAGSESAPEGRESLGWEEQDPNSSHAQVGIRAEGSEAPTQEADLGLQTGFSMDSKHLKLSELQGPHQA